VSFFKIIKLSYFDYQIKFCVLHFASFRAREDASDGYIGVRLAGPAGDRWWCTLLYRCAVPSRFPPEPCVPCSFSLLSHGVTMRGRMAIALVPIPSVGDVILHSVAMVHPSGLTKMGRGTPIPTHGPLAYHRMCGTSIFCVREGIRLALWLVVGSNHHLYRSTGPARHEVMDPGRRRKTPPAFTWPIVYYVELSTWHFICCVELSTDLSVF
jgi:hypothetical protein